MFRACLLFIVFFWAYQNMRRYCSISLRDRQDRPLCKWWIVDLTSRICWGRRCHAQAAISSQIQQRHRAAKWEESINQMSYSTKNNSPSQNIPESYFLIYVQLYYQAAVTFVVFVASVWWSYFKYCYYWAHILCENVAVMISIHHFL